MSSQNTELMAASANLATTFATIGGFLYLYKYYKIRKKNIDGDNATNDLSASGICNKLLAM